MLISAKWLYLKSMFCTTFNCNVHCIYHKFVLLQFHPFIFNTSYLMNNYYRIIGNSQSDLLL